MARTKRRPKRRPLGAQDWVPLTRLARALPALIDRGHRLFPTATEDGIFSRILETLPEDLEERVDHSLSERTSTGRS